MRMWLVLAGVLMALPATAQDRLVLVTGGSGAAHAWTGTSVPIWARVQNSGTATLTGVSVHLLGDDATLSSLCWKIAGAADPCAPTAPNVAAGSALFLEGEITFRTSGDWRPQLLVLWSSDSVTNEAIASVGSLKVEHYLWSWVQWAALPLALGFVGSLFQRRLQNDQVAARQQEVDLQNARLDQERNLAEHREDQEKARAERAETLRIMLPKIHDYATRYYAQLEMRSRNLCASAKGYRAAVAAAKSTPAELEKALNDATDYAERVASR